MDPNSEIWKDIPSFEGVYQISNFGRLKSFKKDKKGYILSNINKKKDYLRVVLRYREKYITKLMHRLVYEVFVSDIPPKFDIDHINGDKQNNCIWNLQCLSKKQHSKKTIENNPNAILKMNYYNISRAKAICQLLPDGRLIDNFNSIREASLKTGVCERNIYQVASSSEYKPGKVRSQAGGYKWKYKEESACN